MLVVTTTFSRLKIPLLVILILIVSTTFGMENSWDWDKIPEELSNSYEVLGVDPFASKEEIDKAYKRLARKHHPDKNLDDKEKAETTFKQLQAAAEVLRDTEARKKYDEHLRQTNISIGCQAMCNDLTHFITTVSKLLSCNCSNEE